MDRPSPAPPIVGIVRRLAPGIGAAALVALVASLAAPLIAPLVPIPAMVLALVIGIAAHSVVSTPRYEEGLAFCVKKLLRWAVALLGLRIALGDIVALGLATALLVIVAMVATILAGFAMARALGWRHVATVSATTLVILAIVVAALAAASPARSF